MNPYAKTLDEESPGRGFFHEPPVPRHGMVMALPWEASRSCADVQRMAKGEWDESGKDHGRKVTVIKPRVSVNCSWVMSASPGSYWK